MKKIPTKELRFEKRRIPLEETIKIYAIHTLLANRFYY